MTKSTNDHILGWCPEQTRPNFFAFHSSLTTPPTETNKDQEGSLTQSQWRKVYGISPPNIATTVYGDSTWPVVTKVQLYLTRTTSPII